MITWLLLTVHYVDTAVNPLPKLEETHRQENGQRLGKWDRSLPGPRCWSNRSAFQAGRRRSAALEQLWTGAL